MSEPVNDAPKCRYCREYPINAYQSFNPIIFHSMVLIDGELDYCNACGLTYLWRLQHV